MMQKTKIHFFRAPFINARFGLVWLLLMIILIVTGRSSLEAQDPKPLTSSECKELSKHHLNVFASDPLNPLQRVMLKNKPALDESSKNDSEIKWCTANYTTKDRLCHLNAKDMISLLACMSVQKSDQAEEDKQSDNTAHQDKKEKKSSDLPKKTTQIEVKPIKISEESCSQAYNHMLFILKDAPALKQKDDKNDLWQFWSSPKSRKKFSDRCQSVFLPEDLGCIINAKDIDLLQACLIVLERE